jgi:hypothetical protein
MTEELHDLYSTLISLLALADHEVEGKHHKLFLSGKLWKRCKYGRTNFRNELGGRGLDLTVLLYGPVLGLCSHSNEISVSIKYDYFLD